jgi:selenocysteine lyase/cysteine desulfurase
MTSRRTFLATTGMLSSALTFPLVGKTSEIEQVIHDSLSDFSSIRADDELCLLLRKQLLVPENRLYLNTGSLGPSPLIVMESVQKATRQLEMNPVTENWGDLGNQMDAVRGKIASLINAKEQEIVLTRNTTEGLSLIVDGLPLKEGDEILTTTHEHEGAIAVIEFVEKYKGVIVKKLHLPLPVTTKEEVIEKVKEHITPKTRCIILSHINTVSGLVMPFAEISAITKSQGIYLIADGAHGVGLVKVDVATLGVDGYAASGHKWLLGPKETGFLFLNERLRSVLHSVFLHSGLRAYSASSGTRNAANIIGLGNAIDLHKQIGVEKIQRRCLEIRNHCREELKKIRGIHVISPNDKELSCGILSFEIEKANAEEVGAKLRQQEIIVKKLPQGNYLRISCHIFVSKQDITRFAAVLQQILS